MWEKFKEIWAGLLLIGTIAWLLLHLVLILIYPVVIISEDNQWILWTEIIVWCGLLILAIERFIKDIGGLK